MKPTLTTFLISQLFLFVTSGILLAQPSDNCNNLTGSGIPVGNECNPVDFNITNDTDYWNSANGCNSGDVDDSWWWFQATSTQTIITYYPTGGDQTGGIYDPIIHVFTAICATGMTHVACADNEGDGEMESLNLTTVVGSFYKIRIENDGSNSNMYGRICIMNANAFGDDPCNAVSLDVNDVCNSKWYSNATATATAGVPVPGCAGYSNRDVWFTVTMPTSDLVINTEEGEPGMNDSGMAVYTAASCAGPFTLVECDDNDSPNDDMSFLHLKSSSILAGTVLYIRVWENGNNDNGLFGICAFSSTQCGNPSGLLNDFCENPAILTKNATANFSATTAGTFTDDMTAESNPTSCIGGFGGTIYEHNNSWYQFTATGPTESFNFSTISCTGDGVQAVVYQVTYNADGCCTGLTQRGDCRGNMTAATTLVANGLIAGNNYVLMVDGYGGAQCDFTISGWGAIGVLPIELTKFSALSMDNRNEITWITESEHNNDYFNLHRSFDGENFEIIATIDGAGNSTQLLNYSVPDYDIRFGMVYYQLEQVDFDGKNTKSQIIALNRNNSENGLVNVYPNPTEGILTIDINVSTQEGGFVRIEGVNGMLIYEQQIEGKGVHQITHDMTFLSSGLYFIRYLDEEVNSVKTILKK
jgi:hypothetical protein